MSFLFFVLAFILFIAAIISFVVALIRKKKKKTSLILLIFAIVCFFISFATSPAPTTTESYDSSSSVDEEPVSDPVKEEDPTYTIGETIKVTTEDGSYTFTIDGVHETADRNQFSDTQADRVIIVDYSYENIDMNESLFISDINFKAYDADNNSIETYPVDTTYAEEISAGRKTTGQMAFALNNATNKVELEYFDNMFNDNKDCLIILEW